MIMCIEIFGQVLVVEFGGLAFRTKAQSGLLWGVAILFGAGSLLWNVVLHFTVDDEWVPESFINLFKITLDTHEATLDTREGDPRIAAARHVSLSEFSSAASENVGSFFAATQRVQSGLRVVRAFQSAGSERERTARFAAATRRVQTGLRAVRAFQSTISGSRDNVDKSSPSVTPTPPAELNRSESYINIVA